MLVIQQERMFTGHHKIDIAPSSEITLIAWKGKKSQHVRGTLKAKTIIPRCSQEFK